MDSYRDRGRVRSCATVAVVCGGSIVSAEEAGEARILFYLWPFRALVACGDLVQGSMCKGARVLTMYTW